MSRKNETRADRQRMMLEDPMGKVVLSMALPMILSALIDSLYNLADTFFVSGIGQTATAAVAINDSLMNLIRAVAMGFAAGCGSYISRLMGAGKDEKAAKVGSTTLIIGVGFGVVVAAVCLAIKQPLVLMLGSTQESLQYSMDYAKWILLATPFTIANTILNQTLKAEGSSFMAMVGQSSGCILNCVLDPIFISVLGMEVEGAALATAISKVFSFVLLVTPYIRHKAMLHLSVKKFKIENDALREVSRMGIPSFLRMALMSTGGIVTNNVAKGFGTSSLAGIAIANKINRFIGSAIMGFSQGLAPIAGFCWGARRYKRTKQAYFVTIGMEAIVAVIVGTLMFIFAEPIVVIFNPERNPEVVTLACLKLRALCLALIPHILVMVTSNLYQAIGKPLGNLVLSMSRGLICLIPLVLILPKIYGVVGLAYTQAVSDAVSGFVMAIPMGLYLLKKIKPLNDGDEPPFGRLTDGRKRQ